MFVNRTDEIRFLDDLAKRDGLRVLLLNGRRRTGKTELLSQFAKNKAAFFFSSDYCPGREQLEQFKEKAFYVSNQPFFRSRKCDSWEALFGYLFERMVKKIPIIIIDEYPVLCASDNRVSKIMKKIFAEHTRKNIFLILSGSDLEFMKKEAQDKSWGPRSVHVETRALKPLKFDEILPFFPDFSSEDRVCSFAILGGKPAYLQRFNRRKTLEQNVKDEILNKNSFLYREPHFQLLEEIREPTLYFAILKAISLDKNHVQEIVRESGMKDVHTVNKYLYVLRKLGVVERKCPVTDEDPENSRKGLYVMEDLYFRFWFRYVFPNMSFLEMGESGYVWQKKIWPNLDEFVAGVFKEICLQRLERDNRYKKLPFQAARIGPWWDRQTAIDAVAYDGKGNGLFCACMWTEKKMGLDILKKLRFSSNRFPKVQQKYFGLFSKSGFSKELQEYSTEHPDVIFFSYH